jgi:hypothetical protein
LNNQEHNEIAELKTALQKAEHSGFGVKSWADINNVVFVGIMLLGCIGWGLKLEWRIDAHQAEVEEIKNNVTALEVKVDKGILPITLVELTSVKEKLAVIREDLIRLQEILAEMQANQIVYRQNEILQRSPNRYKR